MLRSWIILSDVKLACIFHRIPHSLIATPEFIKEVFRGSQLFSPEAKNLTIVFCSAQELFLPWHSETEKIPLFFFRGAVQLRDPKFLDPNPSSLSRIKIQVPSNESAAVPLTNHWTAKDFPGMIPLKQTRKDLPKNSISLWQTCTRDLRRTKNTKIIPQPSRDLEHRKPALA